MKRILCVLLSLVLLVSASAAFAADEENVVHIFSWMGYVDDEVLQMFEEETGIKVIWSPMDSIDSMLLKVTEGGGSDYDLILTSDYSIDILRKGGYLQKIDKTLLPSWGNLNETYLGQTFDPEDEYCMPYVAGCPLIIYDPEAVGFEITGYHDLWDERLQDSVAVLENARVLCGIVLKSMSESMNETDPEILAKMKEKLMPLYKNISVFGDTESYVAMVSEDASVGFLFTPFVYMVEMEHPGYKVVYPEEGLGYGIDGFVIPEGAKNAENAHAFLEFLLRPEIAAHNAEYQGYLCVNKAADEFLSDYFLNDPAMNVPAELLKEAEFILDVGAAETAFSEIYTEFKNQ